MKHNAFSYQTHFIGVLPSNDITLKIEECRTYMNKKYGCKSGHKTPVHVTLIPPFSVEPAILETAGMISDPNDVESLTSMMCQALEKGVKGKNLSFQAEIRGFGSFTDRTIFAYVQPNKEWDVLKKTVIDSVRDFLPEKIIKNCKPFQPHLTVANRDIPSEAISASLEAMNALNLNSSFTVDNIAIFQRNGYNWILGDAVRI